MTTVFQMAPAPAKALWFMAALCLLMAGLTLMFGYLAYSARHARFELSPRSLRLVGDLWGRTIPWEVIDVEGAKALVYVTDTRRIAYVPTSDGYSLLLSLEAPDAFLRALEETKPR